MVFAKEEISTYTPGQLSITSIDIATNEYGNMSAPLTRSGVSYISLSSLALTDNEYYTQPISHMSSPINQDDNYNITSRKIVNCVSSSSLHTTNLQESATGLVRRGWGSCESRKRCYDLSSLSDQASSSSSRSVMTKQSSLSSRFSSRTTLNTISDNDTCDFNAEDLDVGNEMELVVDSWGYFVDTPDRSAVVTIDMERQRPSVDVHYGKW